MDRREGGRCGVNRQMMMMMLLLLSFLLKGVASFHTRKTIDTSYNAYIDDRRHRHIRVERKTMRLNLVEQQIFH